MSKVSNSKRQAPSTKGRRGARMLLDALRAEERTLNARESCAVLGLRERPGCASAIACLKETRARLRLLWRTRVKHQRE